jgi:hypothetical protein
MTDGSALCPCGVRDGAARRPDHVVTLNNTVQLLMRRAPTHCLALVIQSIWDKRPILAREIRKTRLARLPAKSYVPRGKLEAVQREVGVHHVHRGTERRHNHGETTRRNYSWAPVHR